MNKKVILKKLLVVRIILLYSYLITRSRISTKIRYLSELEGDALVAQAAIFFTGGFETSSTTISFSLYALAKNPEIQEKLREEILNSLEESNGKITYDMVPTICFFIYSW